MLSLVIPVYRNEESIPSLIHALVTLQQRLPFALQVVFVIDGSPDRSEELLAAALPGTPLNSRLVSLSRNFGAFSAIGAGLAAGDGDWYAVLAADLQEPPELAVEFARILSSGEADVVFGTRTGRSDPYFTAWTSDLFWWVYRRYVVRDIPKGGVDVFGCTREVRDRLIALKEVDTSLVALLFWVGYRRRFVPYQRGTRVAGKSAWTMAKKLRYSINSIFNFTDLPIRLLLLSGTIGIVLAVVLAAIVFTAWLRGTIPVPGYTPIVLSIFFFGATTLFGLGVIGQYLWITLQNARGRPAFIVHSTRDFPAPAAPSVHAEVNTETGR